MMKLFNCETDIEKAIGRIKLGKLSTQKLNDLTKNIHNDFHSGILENEIVVVDALTQIAQELAGRVK